MNKLSREFYTRDVLDVAPDLLGKCLVLNNGLNSISSFIITEVEAYRGQEDLACHASKGRTQRTEVMYHIGGKLYIYLIYGMYWMLNIVTGEENNPQAVLIRGVENCPGPGRVTKQLGIDKTFYGEDLLTSNRIWIADNKIKVNYFTSPRIGIDYAGSYWKNLHWRYFILP
jgi:DNA-3-methyladenine glycosylase